MPSAVMTGNLQCALRRLRWVLDCSLISIHRDSSLTCFLLPPADCQFNFDAFAASWMQRGLVLNQSEPLLPSKIAPDFAANPMVKDPAFFQSLSCDAYWRSGGLGGQQAEGICQCLVRMAILEARALRMASLQTSDGHSFRKGWRLRREPVSIVRSHSRSHL